jgi:hypothetical protein
MDWISKAGQSMMNLSQNDGKPPAFQSSRLTRNHERRKASKIGCLYAIAQVSYRIQAEPARPPATRRTAGEMCRRGIAGRRVHVHLIRSDSIHGISGKDSIRTISGPRSKSGFSRIASYAVTPTIGHSIVINAAGRASVLFAWVDELTSPYSAVLYER